jgi:hypothetical protein
MDRVASARRWIEDLPDNAATTMLHLLADAVVQRRF